MAEKSINAVETGMQVCLSRRWELMKTGFLVMTWIVLVCSLRMRVILFEIVVDI